MRRLASISAPSQQAVGVQLRTHPGAALRSLEGCREVEGVDDEVLKHTRTIGDQSQSSGGGVLHRYPKLSDRPLSFIDVFYASRSDAYAEAAGGQTGVRLELTGFVTHGKGSEGFRVTRFYISCCVADAVPYWVDVVPSEPSTDYPDDTWLQVQGTIGQRDVAYVLDAEDIEEVPEPDPPYLY